MLAWTIYISFLGVLVLLLPKVSVRAARIIAMSTAIAGLAVTLVGFAQQSTGTIVTVVRVPWVPSLGIEYYLATDGISLTLLLLTGIVAIAGILFSWNIEHRAKYSYFLEFEKNTKLQKRLEAEPDLRTRFARWVRTGKVATGERVRRLPKVLESEEAARLLEAAGFDAAEEYLRREHPEEQELYALLVKARARLAAMTVTELFELKDSPDRLAIVAGLREAARTVAETATRMNGGAA